MSSPVSLAFHSFITIDRGKQDAVYMQIVYQFINAVRRRLLEDGDRLPGSRKIAEDLEVHRKTIVAALLELQEQGWVKTIPNIGTFVSIPDKTSGVSLNSRAFQHPPEKAGFPFRKEFILDSPYTEQPEHLYFTDGTPDYSIIKAEELVRFYAGVLKRTKHSKEWLHTGDQSLFFREQLSYYLNLTRGFHLSRSFLLPVDGREQVFSILSRLLINTGDIILVEEMSYFLPNMIFNQAGARMRTVPLDEEGMNIDFIAEYFKRGEIRFVYINPRSQYPTSVRLSEKRRLQLLELAERYNFIVVEDDVDFEFSISKGKSDSLFQKDGGRRVVYIGTFGSFLTPGFQMNFIIAPKDVVDEAKKYLNVFGKPNAMMEKALGDIIYQGDIHRYQRKSHKVVGERKKMFGNLLEQHFQKEIEFRVPPSGLAIWVRFHKSFPLIQLQEKSKKKGLLIPGICLYQNREVTALRLGFAHLDQVDMEEAVGLLSEAYEGGWKDLK